MLPHEDPAALAGRVDQLVEAQSLFSVLAAAAQLDLVEAIRQPATAHEVASARALPREPVERLLCALVALGLASLQEGERFVATPAALQVLTERDPAFSRARALRFHGTFIAPLLGRLEAAVRTGQPQHRAWPFAEVPAAPSPYQELCKHPDRFAAFLDGMDDDAHGDGAALARILQLGPTDSVIDAGCGGGAVARGLLESVAGLRVESFDLAPAAAIAKARSVDAGLAERHAIATGDVRERWPYHGATVALLSGVLSDFEPHAQSVILSRARDAVVPSGRLALSERILSDDGTEPAGTALLSLMLLAGTEGSQLRRRTLLPLLASSGWELVCIEPLAANAPGGRCVVTARAR